MNVHSRYVLFFFVLMLVISISISTQCLALHDLFNTIDENVDGTVNEAEFSEDMKEQVFNEIDEDSSRSISRKEWINIGGAADDLAHEELFQRIDEDKDRIITFFEFSHYADMHSNIHEAFMGLDKDGSNSLSPDEVSLRPVFKMITIKFQF